MARRSDDTTSLFAGLDLDDVCEPDFKEDSVREAIINPMLIRLGYAASGKYKIQRSKTLHHPFVQVGTGRRKITNFPDYLLTVGGKPAWVLDAKAPNEQILTGPNQEQAYFYAIHPDVRVKYYALCNGREFVAFAVDATNPVLYFHISELEQNWHDLEVLLAPDMFEMRIGEELSNSSASYKQNSLDYAVIEPPNPMVARKQTAKRHFGVHGYFTRQSWDVVQQYIKTFTRPGDLVLDPYGGSGVTLVESLLLGRKAVHIDLNPLSEFIVKNLIEPIEGAELVDAFDKVCKQFEKRRPVTDSEIDDTLSRCPYPTGIRLPRNADVEYVEQLFSKRQLAELALLKALILKESKPAIRNALLLMFSGLINKINLTYHASSKKTEGQGDGSVFRYYRYRIAPQPASLDVMKYFGSRLKKLLAAKGEISKIITPKTIQMATVVTGTATDLSAVSAESVDYIYTDPPYGAKIAYLDLSVMWNSWLGLAIPEQNYELEAIEGGEHNRTKQDYVRLITQSINEMYRVLKFDRWMSLVFQHKDPAYWHLMVEAAERAGFEYRGTTTQNIGQTTFKKRQNPFTVLHGQLIINFYKSKDPKLILKVNLGYEMHQIVVQTIEAIIAKQHGATLEDIHNELIVRGMELGFLDELSKESPNIPHMLKENFDFDDKQQTYNIRKDTKFKTKIPLPARIKYYLISYMRRMQRQNTTPSFDDIVLNIMPLLKNGITPKRQSILSVLKQIGRHVGKERWELAEEEQLPLGLSGSIPIGSPEIKQTPKMATVEDPSKRRPPKNERPAVRQQSLRF